MTPGLPFRGVIGEIDQDEGTIHLSLFLHKFKWDDARRAFEKAGINVVRVQPLAE